MKKKIKDMSDEELENLCKNGCNECPLNKTQHCGRAEFENDREDAEKDYEKELEKIDEAQAKWEEIEIEVEEDGKQRN